MARGFGATYGVGSTDLITTGYKSAGSDKQSWAFWVFKNGNGGTSRGRILQKGTTSPAALMIYTNSSFANSIFLYRNNASGTNTSNHYMAMGTGAWHSVVITHDQSSGYTAPTMYLDGVAQTVTSAGAFNATGSDNTNPYLIGRDDAGSFGWDGIIAWVANWDNTILSALEAAALAAKAPPWKIRPFAVKLCVPLFGLQSPEFDQQGIANGGATVTGAKFQMAPLPDFFDLAA